MNTEKFSITKNIYIFYKYDFFSIYQKGAWLFFDKYILSMFLEVLHNVDITLLNLEEFNLKLLKFDTPSALITNFKYLKPYQIFTQKFLVLISG